MCIPLCTWVGRRGSIKERKQKGKRPVGVTVTTKSEVRIADVLRRVRVTKMHDMKVHL